MNAFSEYHIKDRYAVVGYLQLPYVAATWRTPLPTASRALFSMPATYSTGIFPDFEAAEARSAIVSSSSEVLFRRQDSMMSSRGDAPWKTVSGRTSMVVSSGFVHPRPPW